MRLVPVGFLVLIAQTPLFAHSDEVEGTTVLASAEFWNLATGFVLLSLGLLYALGLRRLWRSDSGRFSLRRWQAAAFAAGWSSVAIALLSRLDQMSDALFSAHMVQHEILMLLSAPLMVLGRPFIVTLWALDDEKRVRIGEALRRAPLKRAWHRATGPLTVTIVHAAVLWIWHVPVLFEAALHSEPIHVLQHLGFFLSAALFWWALIDGRFGKIGYGAGVLYVFATAMHSQILGSLLTFGRHPWYPTHAQRTGHAWLEDQQLAGILMWIPFGVLFLLIALALFAAWIGEAERRVRFTAADAIRSEDVQIV